MPRPDKRNIIYLYVASAQPVTAVALAALDDEERAQAERLPQQEAQIYVRAHLLLREMLRHLAGIERPAFRKTSYGKPYIEGSDLCFNISHTKGKVAVALSFGREVGVDIEEINPHRADEVMARQMFTPDEFDLWQNASNQSEAFFRIWTLKESIMKATGLGSALPLRSFNVTLASPQFVHSPDGANWFCETGLIDQRHAWALSVRTRDEDEQAFIEKQIF